MKYLSALLTQASGSLGGATASKNKGGQYFRKRIAPLQPRTVAQQNVRSQFSSVSASWRGLTQTQIAGWNSLAKTVTLHDALGNAYTPTGAQLYLECAMNNFLVGLPTVSDPPASAPTIPAAGPVSLVATAGGTPVMNINSPVLASTNPDSIIIEATPQLSAGISSIGASKFRVIDYIEGPVTDYSILDPYVARFGTLVAGARVAVRCKVVDSVAGQGGQYASTSVIIG